MTPEDFAISEENGSETVSCPDMAVAPTTHIPAVADACGNPLTASEPAMDDSGFNGCQGNIVYTYTFTDCAGHSHNWIYTYVIELPALTVPQTGSGIVTCANEAVTPTPDTLTDACGREVTATPDASNPTVDIAADGHGTGPTATPTPTAPETPTRGSSSIPSRPATSPPWPTPTPPYTAPAMSSRPPHRP